MNKTIFTFVLVFCCASLGVNSSVQEQFNISRTANSSPRDTFNIPTTTCSATNSSNPCLADYGSYSTGVRCHCKCSHRKPSFLYQSGKWGCVADKIMKEKEGKSLILDNTANSRY